jgi:hypothetical protein
MADEDRGIRSARNDMWAQNKDPRDRNVPRVTRIALPNFNSKKKKKKPWIRNSNPAQMKIRPKTLL